MIKKKQYFLNAHVIDPCNSINEIGGLIIDEQGKIEAAGKRVNKVSDVVKEGDEVSVKVIGFDRGKVKLSIKEAS